LIVWGKRSGRHPGVQAARQACLPRHRRQRQK